MWKRASPQPGCVKKCDCLVYNEVKFLWEHYLTKRLRNDDVFLQCVENPARIRCE